MSNLIEQARGYSMDSRVYAISVMHELRKERERETIEMAFERIGRAVCEHFNVPFSRLKEKKKYQNMAEPRHIIAHLLRMHPAHFTIVKIGEIMDRHHTTIINSSMRVRNFISSYDQYRNDIQLLTEILK